MSRGDDVSTPPPPLRATIPAPPKRRALRAQRGGMREIFHGRALPGRRWALTGALDSGPDRATRPLCDYCRRPMRYAYQVTDQNDLSLVVGSGCARRYLGISGAQALTIERRRQRDDERRRRGEKEKLERERLAEEAFARDRDLYNSLRARPLGHLRNNRNSPGFLDDLARRLREDPLFVLSPRQLEAARRALVREEERANRPPAVSRSYPADAELDLKQVEIVSLRRDFGFYGEELRCVMIDQGGHRLWLKTTPTSALAKVLEASMSNKQRITLSGARVRGQNSDQTMTFLKGRIRPVAAKD